MLFFLWLTLGFRVCRYFVEEKGNISHLPSSTHHMAEHKEGSSERVPRTTLLDNCIPGPYKASSAIQLPVITATHFEIKPRTLRALPIFYGDENAEPYKHLDEFEEICSTLRMAEFSDKIPRLKLFPFSLMDRAKYWLHTLPAGSITTWEQMTAIFLEKYFPIGRANNIKRALTNFIHVEGEKFHKSWECFQDLIRSHARGTGIVYCLSR